MLAAKNAKTRSVDGLIEKMNTYDPPGLSQTIFYRVAFVVLAVQSSCVPLGNRLLTTGSPNLWRPTRYPKPHGAVMLAAIMDHQGTTDVSYWHSTDLNPECGNVSLGLLTGHNCVLF